MKHLICFVCALWLAITGISQTDSTAAKVRFKLGINYNSALNYYGRTDSVRSTGFFPLAEIWFNEKWYVNAAPVFVNNAAEQFDYAGTVSTLGYMRITDRWISSFYITKPFYKEQSQLVQSALKAQAGSNFSFLNKIVNITAGGDIKLSDKIDFGAMAGVDHIIRKELSNKIVLVIDPSAYVYAGTQNFSKTWYRKNTDFLLFPGNTEQVTENVKKFNVLAYELSMPVILAKGKWMLLVTPSFVLPQNLVTISDRPDLTETGKNMFYVTTGLKYSF